MNVRDLEAIEYWQSRQGTATERRLNDLRDTVDDLTTLAQSREGVRTIRQNYSILTETIRKMHDLVLEFKPMEKVS